MGDDGLIGENDRLGPVDLKFLENKARAMIASNIGADDTWGRAIVAVINEVRDTRALLNTPQLEDFFEAVRIEAAHQVERWGVEHDAGKRPEDWIALVVYLLGKATSAHYLRDYEKLLHHVITLAAVALNWHRNATGASTRMRPVYLAAIALVESSSGESGEELNAVDWDDEHWLRLGDAVDAALAAAPKDTP